MNLIVRISNHSRTEIFLILQSLMLLVTVQTGLHWLPLLKVNRLLLKIGSKRSKHYPGDKVYQRQVAWAVNRAGRFLFGEQGCLPKALVGQLLLNRHGLPTNLRIGVRKNETGKLVAHAWLESDGIMIIGGGAFSLVDYSVLPDPGEARA